MGASFILLRRFRQNPLLIFWVSEKKKFMGLTFYFFLFLLSVVFNSRLFIVYPDISNGKTDLTVLPFSYFRKLLYFFFFWFVGLGFRNDYNMMKLKFQLHPCAIFFFALAFLVCLLLLWLSSNSVSSFKMCSFFC